MFEVGRVYKLRIQGCDEFLAEIVEVALPFIKVESVPAGQTVIINASSQAFISAELREQSVGATTTPIK